MDRELDTEQREKCSQTL